MIEWMPVMSRVYHLSPEEVWTMPIEVFKAYTDDLETIANG